MMKKEMVKEMTMIPCLEEERKRSKSISFVNLNCCSNKLWLIEFLVYRLYMNHYITNLISLFDCLNKECSLQLF